ncbi:MAG: hypothetical protein LBM00_10650 [Deltaproteobacteria bacterium]|jgi:hypothetical protein|nr:hypothetical protein [Deltaproteobacteria bacterium]
MLRFRHFLSGLAVLFVWLSVTGCSAYKNTPAPREAETASAAGAIVIEHYASSAPEEFDRTILDRVRQRFTRLDDVFHKRGDGVASYLSRFYAHTDIFHRARRCDSFILAYHPDTRDERRSVECHVAVFTYDSNSPVKKIRSLENRDTTSLRKRPAEGRTGSLTFKAGPEYYRIFFADKRVIFFFIYSARHDVRDDPALYAAALELKEILLNE